MGVGGELGRLMEDVGMEGGGSNPRGLAKEKPVTPNSVVNTVTTRVILL